jgi:hypothetical protein
MVCNVVTIRTETTQVGSVPFVFKKSLASLFLLRFLYLYVALPLPPLPLLLDLLLVLVALAMLVQVLHYHLRRVPQQQNVEMMVAVIVTIKNITQGGPGSLFFWLKRRRKSW